MGADSNANPTAMGRLSNDNNRHSGPPVWVEWLLSRFSPTGMEDELQGDLLEMFAYWRQTIGLRQARCRYTMAVLRLIRPFTWSIAKQAYTYSQPSSLSLTMIRNYLKLALRNLAKYRVYSLINIGGLAVGIAVAMLIGLWIYDELAYDRYNKNYNRIVQVMQNVTNTGEVNTYTVLPFPLADELRANYSTDFTYLVMASNTRSHILTVGENKFAKIGAYFESKAPELLDLTMLYGSRNALEDPASVLLSESVAKAYFGNRDPINKVMKIDNKQDVKVTGVYKDLPHNSAFADLGFIAAWQLLYKDWDMSKMENPWRPNAFQLYAQLPDKGDIARISQKIKDVKLKKVNPDERFHKPQLFLQPMSHWHLYSDYKNGVNAGGRIQYVWLFGTIGVFVLLLACINFMNLSTARSEKRAKEVGIRKAVGSVRGQLIVQFFSESLLVVSIAFALALLLVQVGLPAFNKLAEKQLVVLWINPFFWLLGLGFSLLTGLIAGSYPALYLSSFQPIKVLKGTAFRMGRFAAMPRQVLIVLQFTVSVVLIIGTIVVFRQIQFAKDRPIGYNVNGLIMVSITGSAIRDHFTSLTDELQKTGTVQEIAESGSYVTDYEYTTGGFDWPGKDPGLEGDYLASGISYNYGKTVGWQFSAGRDFSRRFTTDSSGFVVNETAVKFMGLKNRDGGPPIGQTINWYGKPFTIIGVIKDILVESPYAPARPFFAYLSQSPGNFVILKTNPAVSTQEALSKIEPVFKKYNSSQPFDYQLADTQYAKKFGDEERVGMLASFFAALAIFISCLGLFGLASYVAEQRTKEIGVRKVLGATMINLIGLLSKDFVILVVIAFGVSTPIAWYFLGHWLEKYSYRTELSWWIFAISGAGALTVTLLTVSFQSVKAVLMNPVRSLRSD